MTRAIVQRCILLGALLVLLGGIVFLTPTPTQEIEDSVTQETVVETTLPSRPPEGYQVPSRPEVTFPFTHVSADRLRLDNIQKLPAGKKVAVIYPYTRSTELVSPDGQWVLSRSRDVISVARADGSGENRVLIRPYKDSDGRSFPSHLISIAWSWDSSRVFYDIRRTYYSVDVATGEIAQHVNIDLGDDLHSYATARYPNDPVVYFDYDNEIVSIGTYDDSAGWVIDHNIHPQFFLSSLSPNKQMILVWGKGGGSNLSIYAVDGSGLLHDFTMGISPAGSFVNRFLWSPDNTKFVYQRARQDGHSGAILESELYLMNIDGTGRTKLTDTPDIAELLEGWTPDGRLVFSTKEVERVAPNGRLIFSEESDWHVADLVVE